MAVKGTLKNGFKYTIADEALDNWELMELFGDIDNGKVYQIGKAAKILLGDEQLEKFYDSLRGDDGVLKASDVAAAFAEILEAQSAVKN